MEDCPFCQQERISFRIVEDTPLAFAFLNHTPVIPGHVLISPKRHVECYEGLEPQERAEIEILRLRMHDALSHAFHAEGFNYAWNENEVGGQSVPHFHLHMLPRTKTDVGVHTYEPREFIYRPVAATDRPRTPDEELADIAQLLRASR